MECVVITYTNWRGERARRFIVPPPSEIYFVIYLGKTDAHPESQWLVDAFDLERGSIRTFAQAGIEKWEAGTFGR